MTRNNRGLVPCVLAAVVMAVFISMATSAAQAQTFYLLNTEAATNSAFNGQIDQVDIGMPTTRTPGVADVAPSEFSSIGSWKGFATDNINYYFFNTDGGAAFLGRIDSTDLAGTSRTQVHSAATMQTIFANAGQNASDFKGFASDGRKFYFLNTDGAGAAAGEVYSLDLDAMGGLNLEFDLAPSPFSSISAWKGFAADGEFFYLLNTEGSNAFPGQIDRVNLDGTGRTQIDDLDPSLFSNISAWKGFAATVQPVPEPASIAIWSLIGLGLAGFGYTRIRRKK